MLILGVLLWRAEPLRSWHLTAAAVHVLLGTANLVFWQIFIAADMLAGGYHHHLVALAVCRTAARRGLCDR